MKFDTSIVQTRFQSPLGGMTLAATHAGLAGVWFDGQRHLPDELAVPSDWPTDAMRASPFRFYARIDNEMPSFTALTLVAPGVRLSAFAILVTPALAFAIVLSCLTSSLLHSRRTIFFLVFLAIIAPVFCGAVFYHAGLQ